ncbi:MAG: hypothetical protein ACMVO3_22875 [Thalassobaculum sp.]
MDLCDSPEQWFEMSRQHCKAAEALFDQRLIAPAYTLAGTAIECALKGLIMRRERMNRWPARQDRRELYTHRLPELLKLAGLDARMVEQSVPPTEIGVAWAIAKDWSYNSRYATGLKPRDARDILWAIQRAGDRGLLRWIMEAT